MAPAVCALVPQRADVDGSDDDALAGPRRRFDDEQLFYLQARGIPEDVARRLVVRGFFASIVA